MIKEYLELGQIVSTHGIKGEFRLNPWCDSPEFAVRFKTVYLGKSEKIKKRVNACRPHGNIVIMKLEGVNSIEEAEKLRNTMVYIRREDANLPEGTWFIEELVGCKVYDADNSQYYGILSEISTTGANDVWHIVSDDEKEYLIPSVKEVVIDVDVINEKILIRPLKGIFDDAV